MALINLTYDYQKFAEANWSFTYGGTTYNVGFYAYAKLNSQSLDNNQSKVNLKSTYHLKNTSASITIGSVSTWLHYGANPKTYSNATFYSGETTLQEFEITLQHNQDGTSPTQNIGAAWNASFGGNSGTIIGDIVAPKIDRYPMLNPLNDFEDESEPIVTYSTILGFTGASVKVGIHVPSISGSSINSPFVKYRDVNVPNGSYTFNLDDVNPDTNETYRVGLLKASANSNELPVTFVLRTTTTNNTNYDSVVSCKMKIINATPSITSTSFEELDQSVIEFLDTHDAQKIVQYISNVEISIVPNPQKYATIQSIVVNNKSLVESSGTYSTTFDDIQTATFDIVVTDSRGNTYTTTSTRTLLTYMPTTINNWQFERVSATSSNLNLHDLDITCFSGTVNGTQNTPTLQYGIDETNWTTIPSTSYTFQDNKITIGSSGITLTNVLAYTSSGTLYLRVVDLFTTSRDNKTILKGISTFEMGEHDVQVNGDLNIADTNGENAINVLNKIDEAALDIYSTTERIIGRWADGKPVYRSTIEFTLNNGGAVIDISNLNIETIINYYGLSGSQTDNRPINFYVNFGGTDYFVATWFSNNKIYCQCSASYNNSPTKVHLEYTKTTD